MGAARTVREPSGRKWMVVASLMLELRITERINGIGLNGREGIVDAGGGRLSWKCDGVCVHDTVNALRRILYGRLLYKYRSKWNIPR